MQSCSLVESNCSSLLSIGIGFIQSIDGVIEKVIKNSENFVTKTKTEVKPKRKYSENEEDEDDGLEEDENGNLVRSEENINLDDEYDDTFGEMPEEYLNTLASVNDMDKEPELQTELKKEEPEDEWGF